MWIRRRCSEWSAEYRRWESKDENGCHDRGEVVEHRIVGADLWRSNLVSATFNLISVLWQQGGCSVFFF